MMELSKFSVCVVIFYFLALCEASETCRKKSVCSCTFNNGSEVNLKPNSEVGTERSFGKTLSRGLPCANFKLLCI